MENEETVDVPLPLLKEMYEGMQKAIEWLGKYDDSTWEYGTGFNFWWETFRECSSEWWFQFWGTTWNPLRLIWPGIPVFFHSFWSNVKEKKRIDALTSVQRGFIVEEKRRLLMSNLKNLKEKIEKAESL